MEEGGEAGDALRLRALGWNSRLGPESGMDLSESSWRPYFTYSLLSIAVRRDK